MNTLFDTNDLTPQIKMKPRDYQQDCIDKIIWDINNKGNSLCVVATGGGKSLIIAETAKQFDGDVLILQPSKEILEQNYAKLLQHVDKSEIGIYSASMGEKEIRRYTFATIQSVHNKPEEFKHFKLVALDEAHTLNPKSMGMYIKFLKAIGNPKVIGFTATPYRLDTMYVDWNTDQARCVTTIKLINRMKGMFWSRILYNLSMSDLIAKGYLCAPHYIDASVIDQKDVPLNASRSEFDMDIFDKLMESKEDRLLKAVAWAEQESKSVLVFCSSVKKAERLSSLVPGSAVVSAKTASKIRDQIIQDFKNHKIKTVFNVGVLTTGFDHPALDCIILMRPTRSIMLYVQMIGRGVRIAEGKVACKVIDLTSTVKNIGRVETIRVEKDAEGKWDLVSETGSWHGRELYSFAVENPFAPSAKDFTYVEGGSHYTDNPPF